MGNCTSKIDPATPATKPTTVVPTRDIARTGKTTFYPGTAERVGCLGRARAKLLLPLVIHQGDETCTVPRQKGGWQINTHDVIMRVEDISPKAGT